MKRERRTGISSEVRHSVSTIAVLLALPVIAGLFVMILYSSRYQGMIRRMDAAAELKPALETKLAEDLFSVAAGRTSFEESGVLRTIHRIDSTLHDNSIKQCVDAGVTLLISMLGNQEGNAALTDTLFVLWHHVVTHNLNVATICLLKELTNKVSLRIERDAMVYLWMVLKEIFENRVVFLMLLV